MANTPTLDHLVNQLTQVNPKRRARPIHVRRILLCVEPIHASAEAVAWAADLGRRFKAEVKVVSVATPRRRLTAYGNEAKAIVLQEEDAARRVLIDAVHTLEEAGLSAGFKLAFGSPVQEILAAALEDRADLVVVGSHGWGRTARLVLGSTADGLKHQLKSSLLIARTAPPARNVVLAIDGSPLSRRAAGFGLRIAHQSNTRAHLLHVVATSPYASERGVRRLVAQRMQELDLLKWARPGLAFDVQVGREAEAIVRKARTVNSNLIVMGSRGFGGIRSLVAGGVSNGVSHGSKASVLLVKDGFR